MRVRAPASMRDLITHELAAAKSDGDGWRHLERAHVLSQPWAVDHTQVHVVMLVRAWRERDRVEVQGQLVRLLVAGVGSLTGRYPVGNSGRARVPATQAMPIGDHDVSAALVAAGQPASAE